jgi:hypothetical protein
MDNLDPPGDGMTEALPIACSLDPGDLKRRLTAIAAIGAASLLGHESEGTRHLLRFRSDAATRRRLEEIVAAEAACCAFLDLKLEERGGELVLSVEAPEDAQPIADELAATFARAASTGSARRPVLRKPMEP